jgi:hypothetical protein
MSRVSEASRKAGQCVYKVYALAVARLAATVYFPYRAHVLVPLAASYNLRGRIGSILLQ